MSQVDQIDPIQAAIARAQDSAAGAAAVESPASTAVAAPAGGAVVVPGQMLSMNALMSAGLSVDAWLKVKEYGLVVGSAAALVPEILVTIDMTEGRGFIPKMSIKAGNPAQYFSTTDGVSCDKGGSWADAVAKATVLDNKARPYRAVDLPMTLVNDVSDPKGNVLAKAGSTLGHTTATTNWKNWEAFYKAVAVAGLIGQTVQVKLTAERLTNKNNNAWGVIQFELLGVAQ